MCVSRAWLWASFYRWGLCVKRWTIEGLLIIVISSLPHDEESYKHVIEADGSGESDRTARQRESVCLCVRLFRSGRLLLGSWRLIWLGHLETHIGLKDVTEAVLGEGVLL